MRVEARRAGRLPRWLIVYLALLHLALAILLVLATRIPGVRERFGLDSRPDHFARRMEIFQAYQAENVPDGALYFAGDSITQGLATLAVAPCSVNLGIGGDTVEGLTRRLAAGNGIGAARGIVVAIGVNDLLQGKGADFPKAYERLLLTLPTSLPVVASAILPVARSLEIDDDIERANRVIAELCAARAGCSVSTAGKAMADESGDLAVAYHIGDGLHLSPEGYRIWIRELRSALGARGLDRGGCWPSESARPLRGTATPSLSFGTPERAIPVKANRRGPQ